MNIDNTMKELAEYIRLGEEVAANIEGLKDVLKATWSNAESIP